MLGTRIAVPTLDEPVTLKIPAGTAPGTTMRVKGRGVPAHGRHPQGDLLVRIHVVLPKKLDEEAADPRRRVGPQSEAR
jgi:DnaJ-class molecular chaperone